MSRLRTSILLYTHFCSSEQESDEHHRAARKAEDLKGRYTEEIPLDDVRTEFSMIFWRENCRFRKWKPARLPKFFERPKALPLV
jgi:hypothetical protein